MQPRLIQRSRQEDLYRVLLAEGLPEVVARVVSARPVPLHVRGVQGLLSPQLADLDAPVSLKGIDRATSRILKAVQDQEIIGFETDHDCDGQTSHAVLYEAFTQIFKVPDVRLRSYIGHRLAEGYGLSEKLAHRILADPIKPSLIITADNGSSDEKQIALLKSHGIDIIVTDHHGLPLEGPPESALACINPTQDDCAFPDSSIAGCMVAWLLMASVRRLGIEQGVFPKNTPSLAMLLDFVAVGTVADCVSLSRSVNNRAVVQYGLTKIQKLERPCWQAIQSLIPERAIGFEDLGFLIGPLLNSDGRLGDAFQSVNFLLSKSLDEAMPWVRLLFEANQTRKTLQKEITDQAMQHAEQQVKLGRKSLVIYLKEGHAGVHGISATKVKDAFGRPTLIFAPKQGQPGVMTGSGRSLEGLHLKNILQQVASQYPQMLIGFGGHAGAAGLMLYEHQFEVFSMAFEARVSTASEHLTLGPVIYSDGRLEPSQISLTTVHALQQLEPFGREFEAPQFEIEPMIIAQKPIGHAGNHLKLRLDVGNQQWLDAVWFFALEDPHYALAITVKRKQRFLIRLQENHYQGRVQLQAQIVAMLD